MPAPLRCPTCSAPLDMPAPHATLTRCSYCGAGVLLTERGGSVEAAATQRQHADAIAEVLRQLRAGSKIGAIKVYHERFGVGLKEARDAVERLEAGQPAGTVPADAPAHGSVSARTPAQGSAARAMRWAFAAALGTVIIGVMAMRGERQTVAEAPRPLAPSTVPPPPVAAPEEKGPPAFAEPVLRFGSEGTGAGRFEDARAVAVDAAGRIYVGEYSGGRVQVFDSAGTFLTQWVADRRMPLRDVAAGRDGTVYVVQSGRIKLYEGPTGKELGEFGRPSSASYDDVAVALDGTLWAVDDYGHTVKHLSREGRTLRSIDLREAVDEDASPARIAVAGTGDVYVLDRWSSEIYRLDAGGRFVDRFGGRGDGPGNFRAPEDLVVDGRGRVYVSDMGDAIRVFSPDGQLVAGFGGTGVVFGMAFNDRDELFATYRNDHQIVKFRLTP